MEAILEKSAWRQQVLSFAGNASVWVFIYFFSPHPDDESLALENQQYTSATNTRQYVICCRFWNAVSWHLSQLYNLAKNPPGNIKIQLLKRFYIWKLFMSFYIFLEYIKFFRSSGLHVHLMDDWDRASSFLPFPPPNFFFKCVVLVHWVILHQECCRCCFLTKLLWGFCTVVRYVSRDFPRYGGQPAAKLLHLS